MGNPLESIAKAKQAAQVAKEQSLKGVGTLPAVTADGQESSKLVVPTVEAKAGAVLVSSAETPEQALQVFVKGIPNGSVICLTNKEGTAKNYYMRKGDELYSGRDGKGKEATAKAFGQKNNDWKAVPVENDVSAKKSTVSAESGSGVVPTAVGAQAEGSQLEESKTFKAFREKLAPLIFDVFPKRLEEIDNLTVLNTLRSEERPHIEVIRHNWQSEIGFVYKCLSPEDQKRANVYIKQENRICLDAIEKKEDILIKDAKRQWYAIAENELPFQKAVAEKAKMIIDAIAVARGLRELKNIGQERFVKVNGEKRKERRFFSVGMFFSKYENDPAMIGVLNSIADQKDSPAEKEISSLWEGKLRSLEEELAPGAKIINDQLSIVISEKRALLQSLTSENKISKQSEIYFSRFFEDLEATAVDFFKDFDSEGLQSVLTRAKEIELKPEDIKQQKPRKERSASAKLTPVATGKPVGTMPDVDASKVVSPYGDLSASVDEPAIVSNTKDETIDKDAQWEKIVSPANKMIESNPFEGSDDSEDERGQTEEEKKYESLYQMLGKDSLKISLEEERMKGVIAAGLQKFEERLKEKLEKKDVNLVELVHEHREALASSLLESILIRLGQFPFDQVEKEFFARRFIETYFEDHKI